MFSIGKATTEQPPSQPPTSSTAITSSDSDASVASDTATKDTVAGGSSGAEEDEDGEELDEENEPEEEEPEEEERVEENQDPHPPCVEFNVGELVWGAARGHPSLPGKVVPPPSHITAAEKVGQNGSVWVRWFGGRPVIELVPMESLKSLSEGLDAHHKALKDTRK